MMFFLARSALCIGVVAAAASGIGSGRLARAVDREVRGAAAGVGRACLASSGCLQAGTAALASVGGSPAELPRRSPKPRAVRPAAPAGG